MVENPKHYTRRSGLRRLSEYGGLLAGTMFVEGVLIEISKDIKRKAEKDAENEHFLDQNARDKAADRIKTIGIGAGTVGQVLIFTTAAVEALRARKNRIAEKSRLLRNAPVTTQTEIVDIKEVANIPGDPEQIKFFIDPEECHYSTHCHAYSQGMIGRILFKGDDKSYIKTQPTNPQEEEALDMAGYSCPFAAFFKDGITNHPDFDKAAIRRGEQNQPKSS